MSSVSVGAGNGTTPINVTGLASGLDTTSIIEALLSAEKLPITHLQNQQEKLQGQVSHLQALQSSMRTLSFSVFEFRLGSLFETTQAVTSSEPLRVSAATTGGAGVGGYEVEVKQLANSAQRTFAYTVPAGEDQITVDGHEYTVKAGATAKELATKINADSTATVYAAATDAGTLVFSSRTTGATEGEFINVSDTAGSLTEKAGTAKEGRNAEYTVDGVVGTSTSNVVTSAIAGVTLTLSGITSSGPITITVQPPGPNVTQIEGQVNAFITQYNATIEAVHKEVTTRPVASPKTEEERGTGTLFGDVDLTSALYSMRQAMYEPLTGLPEELSSPRDIGISEGAATGGGSTQSSLEGLLKLDPAKLASAIQANPTGVKEMLQGWSKKLEEVVNNEANTGGPLYSRISGDETQVSDFKVRISAMNEMLAVRQRALVRTYAQLETVIAHNSSQSSWLTNQVEQLSKSSL
ncbi:MAG TPA: flagellar filament capping protein FliD [Solirubrobacteraceae bacterium]|jgi:flagellar hook-associated protein 2|nr:flagellar filament capping protein FliD [Solirubrobacteraceae bacterium]